MALPSNTQHVRAGDTRAAPARIYGGNEEPDRPLISGLIRWLSNWAWRSGLNTRFGSASLGESIEEFYLEAS